MYPIVRVSFGVFVSVVLLILFSNSCGFFISPQDDPAWAEVVQDDGGSGASASLTGPGVKVYQRTCQSCHGADGKGISGIYPSLAGSEWAQGDIGIPVRLVLHGFSGEIERNGVKFNGVMAPWGEVLSDQEIANVVTTVRSSFGNSAGEVSEDEVAAIRAATSSRIDPYTEASVLAEASATASAEE